MIATFFKIVLIVLLVILLILGSILYGLFHSLFRRPMRNRRFQQGRTVDNVTDTCTSQQAGPSCPRPTASEDEYVDFTIVDDDSKDESH